MEGGVGMELVKEYLSDFVDFFEYFSFFYVVFRKKFRKQSRQSLFGIFLCLTAMLVGTAAGWDLRGNTIPFSELLWGIFIILYCMFQVSVKEMIGLAIAQWLVISILETTIHVSLSGFNMGIYRLEITIMLIISISLWVYYLIIGKNLKDELFQLPVKMWYLLDLIMLILTTMMEFFSYVVVEELLNSKATEAGKGLVIVGGNSIVLLLFAMIYYFNQTKNLQLQKELVETQGEQQREYFLQLLEKEEETRRFRHDMINDLLEIQNYCEKKDYEKLMCYLKSTLGVIQNISKSSYDVGNDIINTVLNYYLQPVKEKYEIEINGYVDETLCIEQRDLCVICANLIKNAVEAVRKQDSGKVIFDINQGTQYLSIKVTNTFEGNLALGKDGLPETTKKDKRNHGIGLQNVKQIVHRYDGRYALDVTEGRYQVEIFLKLGAGGSNM